MMTKNASVFGVYSSRGTLDEGIAAFKDAGFSNSDISVLLPDKSGTELVTESGTKGTEGAAVGLGSGAVAGGALGWLVGIGALVLPGIGPVIAAGPIVAALAGVGMGGALGGFAGCLIGVGITENEAEKYKGQLLTGGTLVAIHCDTAEEIKRATAVMQAAGAEDIACSERTSGNRPTAA